MKKTAIIVAGGSGERVGGAVPKQFFRIKGKPIIIYTLEKFLDITDEVILVLPESHLQTWNQISNELNYSGNIRIVTGGTTRQESVRKGLDAITGTGIVAIHDAVRPFVSKKLIVRLFDETNQFGNAIPVISVKESMRKKTANGNISVTRSDFFLVQTPQCFNIQIIKEAYKNLNVDSMTDDASVAELHGIHIHLVTGENTNIKITFPEDLKVAEALIDASIV